MKTPRNVAASVRQRLLNRAREEKRPFQELLLYYAMERFLYRLCQSAHADRYMLKGALLLRVWGAPEILQHVEPAGRNPWQWIVLLTAWDELGKYIGGR